MSASILVAYATRYGSTEEVAEAVAETLRENGFEVDVRPMREVRGLEGYQVVVLGAPIYIGRWHKEAHRFLSQDAEVLTERLATGLQVAIFALGPIHDDEDEYHGAREVLDAEVAKYPWLKPLAIAVFGGRYDPSKLRLADRLLTALPASPLHGVPASDVRDWPAIQAWAGDLATKLQPALSRKEAYK